MEIARNLLVLLHFIGFASLLGGFLTQMKATERRVVTAMVHGALTQLVTGVALVGLIEASSDGELNHAKIGVKLVVLMVLLVLVWLNRARATVANGVYFAIGGLTVLNMAIAVLWG